MSSSNRPSREKEILDAAAGANAAASAPTDTTSNNNNSSGVIINLGSEFQAAPAPAANNAEEQADFVAGLQQVNFSSSSSSSSQARRPSQGQQEEQVEAVRPTRSNFMRWLAAGLVVVGLGFVATGILAAPGIAIIASAQPVTTAAIALFVAVNAFLASALTWFVDSRARRRDQLASVDHIFPEDHNQNHAHADEDEFAHAHAPSQAAILARVSQNNGETQELNGEEVSAAPASAGFKSYFSGFAWMSGKANVVPPVSNNANTEELNVDASNTSSMNNSI